MSESSRKNPKFNHKLAWGNFIHPVMRYFRVKRLEYFVSLYPELAQFSVLDIGGRPFIWDLLKEHYGLVPRKLILLNTESELNAFEGYETEVGDGRSLPYPDKSFDLVFSNSVIEHVGDREDMLQFARECSRVGNEIFIQTPNRWFPVETHLVTAFIHWLPRSWFRRLSFLSVRYLSLWRNKGRFYSIFDGIKLLSRSQLQVLFPNKIILTESFLGWAKSFTVTDRDRSVAR